MNLFFRIITKNPDPSFRHNYFFSFVLNFTEPIILTKKYHSRSGQLGVLIKSMMKFYNIQQRSSEESDDKAPVQIIVDKISRQLSNGSEVFTEPRKLPRSNSVVPSPQIQIAHNSLSNFCWFKFNTNKLLVAKRTRSHYGLKYYILNVINGNATMVNSVEMSTTSANGCQATPLALTLNSQIGLAHLLRPDFINNCQICDRDKSLCSKMLKRLWNWFENVNSFFEKTIPINPRNTSIDTSQIFRGTLSELYSTRYSGLVILLNDLDQAIKKNESYEIEKNRIERFKKIIKKNDRLLGLMKLKKKLNLLEPNNNLS
ncbi:hypothetical protein BpHYR1_013760 [Brachionus plicatilis]|uniref:Uncharacterized protein n=1 Tax=Brachionus plicatilis TaxID=10195 RepID=A0A3M7RBE8_BRAPC|nr:hypothetical protein BpHYR1_013760 [Brachionus plicatilis]